HARNQATIRGGSIATTRRRLRIVRLRTVLEIRVWPMHRSPERALCRICALTLRERDRGAAAPAVVGDLMAGHAVPHGRVPREHGRGQCKERSANQRKTNRTGHSISPVGSLLVWIEIEKLSSVAGI